MSKDQRMDYGRRSSPVITPVEYVYERQVDAAESYDEPLIVLPHGWEDMSTLEIQAWAIRLRRQEHEHEFVLPHDWDALSTVELDAWGDAWLSRHEQVAHPDRASGQAAPKGEWDVPWRVYEWGVPASCTSLTYLDPEPLDRQPGDGAFGGGRPGSTANYRDDEQAAGRVVYFEDEPVVPEEPAVAWDAYPSSWDVPVESTLSATPLEKPRLQDFRAGMRAEMWERVDAEVAAWQALGSKSRSPGVDPGDYVSMWWCGEFQMWSPVLCTADGNLACVECDNWINGRGDEHDDTCPGMEIGVAL